MSDRPVEAAGARVEQSDLQLVAGLRQFRLGHHYGTTRSERSGRLIAVPHQFTASETQSVNPALWVHHVGDASLRIDHNAGAKLDN